MSAPVIVYGASGYTGKLISWHLAEAGIPFIAAGRDQKRLEEQMARVPELKGASFECRAVPHDAASLGKLFAGAKVVYNVTGPFMQLGDPVVQAALDAGCHYLDTTGEADWMRHVRDSYGAKFAARGLLVAPATSYMWAAGNIAAEIALETPGIDSLDILYLADSATSVASTKSFLRMCTRPQYYIEHRKLVQWPMATSYLVKAPDSHRLFRALPWAGGGEPVWYEGDARVSNCSTLVGFRNQLMFDAVIAALENFEKDYRHLPDAEQERICNELGGQLTQVEPDRENPDVNRSVISCIGRGNTTGVSVVLRGNSPYIQTGLLAAEGCRRILRGQLLAAGFQSPAKAFGARAILNAWAEHGYHSWEAQAT
ncbi:saccharopine dehydrogenase family protein [Sphingosinicella microcystinivorans]|uniref:saccharopine dehydrogenase family protein n=1 Tax=Sphingosinicella microcystinivorans TaxID=335406 RepID=UPI0022F37EE1|nr:DUF5938 domain-containing protein [Sphingosinicella microcystinivorans]WBX84288.1 DUF5938 domain-containing protein [Sphingosinicella microcystinivorans]